MPGASESGLKEDLTRRMFFLRSMLAQPRQVGAVWPTSRRAVRDLLDMGDIASARTVVEFGVGTGVYTREIVDRLGPDSKFLAFEIDSKLASSVSKELRDPRLRVINDSAENAESYLEGDKADVIISSLPFTTFPAPLRDNILDLSRRALSPGGVMLVLQYSPRVLPYLRRRFFRIERRISPLNVPPAFLYACEGPSQMEGS
ncbi:rRNA adenine N-6-methyltransferase family protein [soil metagenome]